MTKKNLFIVIGVLFFININLYGQEYFMYVNGKKCYFQVSPNKMMVQYSDNTVDSVNLRNSLQRMSINSRQITKVMNEFMLVELENTSKEQVIDLVEQWKVLGNDIYISPILSDLDGAEFSFIPNQIFVSLHHENDYSLLLKVLQTYKACNVIKTDIRLPRNCTVVEQAKITFF